MKKVILSLASFILRHWLCVVAVEMPVYTKWTVHTSKKIWSQAEMLCEMKGGHLANLNTTHKNEVFEHFLGQDPWKPVIDYGTTVSLHNVNDDPEDPYVWLPDCSTNTVSYSFTSSLTTSGGCVSKGESSQWKISCIGYENEFCCERTWGSACPYQVVVGKKPISTFTYTTEPTASNEECQLKCDELGINCWAAARFDSGNGRCYLYKDTSPFTFEDQAATLTSDSSFTTFLKSCYEALVDSESYDWLLAPGSTEPISTCNAASLDGKVYTLVKEAKSWGSARAHCSSIGQRLAGSEAAEDRAMIQTLAEHYYESTYTVSSLNPYWVDFTGHQSGTATWGNDGSAVSGTVTVQGSGVQQCGMLDIADGSYFLSDCSQQYSFMCLKTDVPCTAAVVDGVYGTDKEDQGSISLEECDNACEGRRNAGPQSCEAYSYRPKVYFTQEKCYLHTSSFSGFLPLTTSDSKFTMYRHTGCVWVALQEVLMEDVTTEVIPTTTTSTTSTEGITTEAQTTTTTTVQETTITTSATTADATTTEAETTTETTAVAEETTTTATTESTTTTETSISTVATTTSTEAETTTTPESATTAADTTPTTLSETGEPDTTTTTIESTTTETETSQPTTLINRETTTRTAESTAAAAETTKPEATSAETSAESTTSPCSTASTPSVPSAETTTSFQHHHDTSTSEPSTSQSQAATAVTVTATSTSVTPKMCVCRCAFDDGTMPSFNETQEQRIEDLLIQKNTTYRNRAKYFSVPDHRASARSIGAVAIVFLATTLGVIFAVDLSKITRHASFLCKKK